MSVYWITDPDRTRVLRKDGIWHILPIEDDDLPAVLDFWDPFGKELAEALASKMKRRGEPVRVFAVGEGGSGQPE